MPSPWRLIIVLERMEHAVPKTIAATKTTSSKHPHVLLASLLDPPLILWKMEMVFFQFFVGHDGCVCCLLRDVSV
jgi:hypothetical protein